MQMRYTLVLSCLNNDFTDLSGMEYPESGNFVAENYKPNKRLDNGLYGVLWGKARTDIFHSDETCKWIVLKTEIDEDFITISEHDNLVKFKKGVVACCGTLDDCTQYIAQNGIGTSFVDSDLIDIIADQEDKRIIVGDNHVLHGGFNGRASSECPGTHAIVTGKNSDANAGEEDSHAISLSQESRALSSGNNGHAFSLGRARACGENGAAISIDGEALSSGINGIAISLSEEGHGSVGPNGILVLTWMSKGRRRCKVGHAGEDVEPNIVYKVENDEFVEV